VATIWANIEQLLGSEQQEVAAFMRCVAQADLSEGVEVSLIEIGKVEHCMGRHNPGSKNILKCERRAQEVSVIGLPLANWVQLQVAVLLIKAGHAGQPVAYLHHAARKLHPGTVKALSSLCWGAGFSWVLGLSRVEENQQVHQHMPILSCRAAKTPRNSTARQHEVAAAAAAEMNLSLAL